MTTRKLVLLAVLPWVGIFIFLAMQGCAIRPLAWYPEVKPEFSGPTALNEKLAAVEKISLDGWYGPEDILLDAGGNMYTGVHRSEADFTDGRILKITPDGQVETYLNTGSWVAGLHFDSDSNLIALSHKQGLIRISPDKTVTVLAGADADGKPFLIPNGLDIAADGKIYFTNTSEESAYDITYGRRMVLEMKKLGGLYCYDPSTQKVETLIRGTYFGNGVVLSEDESHVLMVETTAYRVLRYWLTGDQAGHTEVFIDNLPGFPNGITRRDDGTYWLGFSTKRSDDLDNIHPKPGMKKVVYALPEFMQPKAEKFGMVLHLSKDGEIIESLFDPSGESTPETGAVKENNGYLYLGGDVVSYIARFRIEG